VKTRLFDLESRHTWPPNYTGVRIVRHVFQLTVKEVEVNNSIMLSTKEMNVKVKLWL